MSVGKIWDCFGLVSFHDVIGPENKHHFLNQSDLELKPTSTWSPAFSRASYSLIVLISSSHWLPMIFCLLWVAGVKKRFVSYCHVLGDTGNLVQSYQ